MTEGNDDLYLSDDDDLIDDNDNWTKIAGLRVFRGMLQPEECVAFARECRRAMGELNQAMRFGSQDFSEPICDLVGIVCSRAGDGLFRSLAARQPMFDQLIMNKVKRIAQRCGSHLVSHSTAVCSWRKAQGTH